MSISLLASVSPSAEWVQLCLNCTSYWPDWDHSDHSWHRERNWVAILFQEDDEAVSKHGHPHQEIRQGQPVASPPDSSLPAVVAIEENGVLQVALPRERSASSPAQLPDCRPASPSPHRSSAKPQPHPQGPDGVQVLSRSHVLLGDGLAGRASEGLACDELGERTGCPVILWAWEGTRRKGVADPQTPTSWEGSACTRSLAAVFLLDSH